MLSIFFYKGYSLLWENQVSSSASKFWIWVGVEVSDHPFATADSIHQVQAAVSVADNVVTSMNLPF